MAMSDDRSTDPSAPAPTPAPPRDAATVLLLRDEPEGFSVFLVRRHGGSGFMAGAHVFPGGVIEDADLALGAALADRSVDECAALLCEDDPARCAALFVTAIRETFEESGVLLAHEPPAELASLRAHHAEANDFAALVQSAGLRLAAGDLVPQARWITPTVEKRRYDTRFFLARAPANQRATHDDKETTESCWMRPAEALEAEGRGEIRLPPPTARTLEHLARFARTDEVLADAAARRPPLLQPVFHDQGAAWVLALPGDPLHPVGEPAFPGSTRYVLEGGRWWARTG